VQKAQTLPVKMIRTYYFPHSAMVFAVGADDDTDGDAAKADHERSGKNEAQRFLVTILAARI
jgi:hypothetical protein